MMREAEEITGEYGVVVEHPTIRGLTYMVVCPSNRDQLAWAIVLNDSSGYARKQQEGSLVEIGMREWIIRD